MTEFSQSLRESAPALPPELKSRTLAKCAAARHQKREKTHRLMTLAVAGVLGLQLLTLSRLDAQNAQLIAGNSAPRAFAAVSHAEVMESLRERSRQLALLMEPSKLG